MSEPVEDSPVGWVRDHIRAYTATDGARGHLLQGRPTLLLTTRGRRSGLLRRTGATYLRAGEAWVVADSDGGSSRTPDWVRNLQADARATVQAGAQIVPVVARFAEGAERDGLWRGLVALDPTFAALQSLTTRRFHVIVLEPAY